MPHVTFVYPCMGRFPDTRYARSWQMQPLSIGVLSSLTPSDWQRSFFDDRLESIDFSRPTDLAAISIETFTARRGYQIADEYRRRGIPVVLGGYHATLCPEEAIQHSDAICVGEAEPIWRNILQDAMNRKLAGVYTAPRPTDLVGVAPDRSIYRGKKYFKLAMVESGRGCRFKCSFCAISAFHEATYRRRPVDEIVGEITRLGEKIIFFVDDNIIGDLDTARELFQALIPLKINWIGQCSVNAAADEELLELMVRSGCRGLLVGFESLNTANLKNIHKAVNASIGYEQALNAFRRTGIAIYGTFMFGLPDDTAHTINDTLDFAKKQKMFLAAFAQLIPFPGTALYSQLQSEGRLMHPRWWLSDQYRFGQAPFYPTNMATAELEQACYLARRSFYSYSSILHRSTEFAANCSGPKIASVFFGVNYLMHREVSRKFGVPLGVQEPSNVRQPRRVIAETASQSNDAEIRNLLWQVPMPGSIKVAFLRDPSFPGSLSVEGRHSQTVIGRDKDTRQIIGLGTRSVKTAYINGTPSPLGYLGTLRLRDGYRGSTYLARGYRELKRLHEAGPAKLYVSTIIEDNRTARKALTSGRAGLPIYHDVGRYCSLALNLKQRRRASMSGDLQLRNASDDDISSLIDFWHHEGRRRQFFPEYMASDLTEPDGLLRGLKPSDILLAFKNKAIVGTVGAWNQMDFRQSRVVGYERWLRLSRPYYNLAARFLGYPCLPRPGTRLNYVNLAVVCIQDDDRDVFRALFSRLLEQLGGSYEILMAGMHENDPLLEALTSYRRFGYFSRFYVVCWDDGEECFRGLDGRVPYLELGAL